MKSVRIFFVVIALIWCSISDAQENVEINCLALTQALKNEVFQKVFSFCENKDKVFIIVDTSMFLTNCRNNDLSCRRVMVVHEWVKERNANTIVVFKRETDRKRFAMEFFSPYTGSAVMFCFKRKKNKVKIVESRFGDY